MKLGSYVAVAALCAAAPLMAQYNQQWIAYGDESAQRLVAAANLGLSDVDEKDYASADVDKDGDLDLICVRKEPFTTPGRRTNVLFMNEGVKEGHAQDGVLVDRTAQYAVDSDVPGDMGFLTPTNDRDIAFADFNLDGWLDFATAVTISDGLPKAVSHPRIYMNKGASGGVWQGFRFEAGRSPQLYVLNANGTPNLSNPQAGRFCSIGVGDVTGDGFPDIYLGDYDSGGSGTEPAGIDLNDRLWVNDGTGFFSDSYQTRIPAAGLVSAFSTAAEIVDMNNDGRPDVVKATGLQDPRRVDVIYNNGATVGSFSTVQTAYSSLAPYFVSVGDLNNDGLKDIVVTDDGADRFRLAASIATNGIVVWNPTRTFNFLSGSSGDGEFGGQSKVTDLNNDGWNDVIITDVDVDIAGCNRVTKVYHNLGNAPTVTLRQEREMTGGLTGPGWLGAVGLTSSELTGVFNVEAFDIDRDGWKDLVLGRCTGTKVMMCRPPGLQSVGGGTPGCQGQHKLSGNVLPRLNTPNFALTCTNAPANGSGFLLVSTVAIPGGSDLLGIGVTFYLNVLDPGAIILPVTADANGRMSFPVPIPNSLPLAGFSINVQAAWLWPVGTCPPGPSPFGYSSSNGLVLTFLN